MRPLLIDARALTLHAQVSCEIASYSFPSPIFALGICPNTSWVAVGYGLLAPGSEGLFDCCTQTTEQQYRMHRFNEFTLQISGWASRRARLFGNLVLNLSPRTVARTRELHSLALVCKDGQVVHDDRAR